MTQHWLDDDLQEKETEEEARPRTEKATNNVSKKIRQEEQNIYEPYHGHAKTWRMPRESKKTENIVRKEEDA